MNWLSYQVSKMKEGWRLSSNLLIMDTLEKWTCTGMLTGCCSPNPTH